MQLFRDNNLIMLCKHLFYNVQKRIDYMDFFILFTVMLTRTVTLQRMASAYASVCSYAHIRSQTLKYMYVRGTLGIRSVRSYYADIRRCTLCYSQRPYYFFDMFKIYQHMQAFGIYVTHTLTICTAYTGIFLKFAYSF